MKAIHNSHDKFFRSVMANLKVATEFLQHHLPTTLKSELDFKTLESGSYIRDFKDKLGRSATIILGTFHFQVRLLNKAC